MASQPTRRRVRKRWEELSDDEDSFERDQSQLDPVEITSGDEGTSINTVNDDDFQEDTSLDPVPETRDKDTIVEKKRKRQCLVLILLLLACGSMFGIGFFVGSSTHGSDSDGGDFRGDFPTPSPTFVPPDPSNVTVGVYYYPWYDQDRAFHGSLYVRKDLGQYPLLGEYNDRDPTVIAQHLAWSRKANIGVWITSWWGPNSMEDDTTRTVILPHKDIGDLKIAIHYESLGRSRNDNGKINETIILQRAGPDVTYLCQEYFKHPNYLRIDDRPVIIFYLSRRYERLGLMRETAQIMRNAAAQCGEEDIYLIGDHAFRNEFMPFDYVDAITNFDVYGSTVKTDGYANQTSVDDYIKDQKQWRNLTRHQGVDYIPAVSPGFNDRAVRQGNGPMSRKISPDAPYGSLFEEMLREALDMVEPATQNMVLINSFNEFHEDTQIEPVVGFASDQPFDLTQGLEYEGYAFMYLDMVRSMTVNKEQVTEAI